MKKTNDTLTTRLLLLMLLLGLTGCQLRDRTTVIYGTITDEDKQPIAGIPLAAVGQRRALSFVGAHLNSTGTNSKGEYTMTMDVPKEYHSLYLYNKWFEDTIYQKKYKGYIIYFDDVLISDDYPAGIGEKNKYDFIMVRR